MKSHRVTSGTGRCAALLLVVAGLVLAAAGGAGGCAPRSTTPSGGSTTMPSGPTTSAASATAGVEATSTSNPATSTPASPTPQPTVATRVYFIRAGFVGIVSRRTPASAPAAGAMDALVAGPTSSDRAAGLTSEIPHGTTVGKVTIDSGGVATVDLSAEFRSAGSDTSRRLRVAQVVCTLTQFPSIRRVRLLIGGKPVAKLGPVSLAGALARADIESSLPAILVETPFPFAKLTSPMTLSGSANVFEARFVAELLAPDGTRISRQTVRATSGTGTRGSFSATLRFTARKHGKGRLKVYELSAKDGSAINIVQIPVMF